MAEPPERRFRDSSDVSVVGPRSELPHTAHTLSALCAALQSDEYRVNYAHWPNSTVLSDGLGCFAAMGHSGCLHTPVVVGERKPRDLPQFQWVNTVLGNLKTTLAGAFHPQKVCRSLLLGRLCLPIQPSL